MGQRGTNEFLRVKVDTPAFKVEISSQEPGSALPELRKILELMSMDEEIVYEEFVAEELKTTFSDGFINNQKAMTAVKQILKQEDDYRIATTMIPSTATLDLEQDTQSIKVQKRDVQKAITQLTTNIDEKAVKQGIIHIGGALDRDSRVLVVDHIHKHMPTAHLRAFQTPLKNKDVLVECIFFGEFPE
ncbi:MAG: hypothetical protein OXR66_06195 [Candidatus Woesearchaeota archaeon]|nr:hypothetical protein [Candidatus Woesearchaeota archaeon]